MILRRVAGTHASGVLRLVRAWKAATSRRTPKKQHFGGVRTTLIQ